MALLPSIDGDSDYRTRRWDALVVGSGLSSLIAAIRIGMKGHSVLVLEEPAARDAFPGLREPFYLSGAPKEGPLDLLLREMTLSLMDRRRIIPQSIAYQVVADDLRLDVGLPDRSAEELTTWGLADEANAAALVEALRESAEAERRFLLEAPVVRTSRLPGRGLLPGSQARGLPAEVTASSPKLAGVLRAQLRAVSNLATAAPSPEAQARLLGAPLAGSGGFEDGPPWLMGVLRRRLEAVYGETRSLPGKFEFVTSAGHAGVRVENSREILTGRALLVAPPACALAQIIPPERSPDFLKLQTASRRRISVHFRTRANLIPEAMAPRVILTPPPESDWRDSEIVTLALFHSKEDPRLVDLVASAVVDSDVDLVACEAALESRVRSLLPFARDEDWNRPAMRRPVWDDDGWLEDPPPSGGWPGEVELQISQRPRIYHFQRQVVAGLGFEGDLMMGWRAGDLIAGELS